MANATHSKPEDLMLGAGTLYFDRLNDDGTPSGLRILGNVSEMTVTNDITVVEKNSSMTSARELMASIVTDKKVSLALTMDEYDPANLAIGFYGEEGVFTQAQKTVVDESHVISPNSILQLKDTAGKAYFNVDSVVVKPASAIPATVGAVTKVTALASDGLVEVTGTYTGTANKEIHLKVVQTNTTAGQVAGIQLAYADSLIAVQTGIINFTATADTETVVMAEGLSIKLTLGVAQKFTVNEIYKFPVTASIGAYVEGRDYLTDEISVKAGLVYIPEASTIAKDTSVLVSYNVPAMSMPKVSGNTANKIMGKLLFVGDPNCGRHYNAEFHKISIRPDGAMSGFIGTDFGSFSLTADVLSDKVNHPDSPFFDYIQVK